MDLEAVSAQLGRFNVSCCGATVVRRCNVACGGATCRAAVQVQCLSQDERFFLSEKAIVMLAQRKREKWMERVEKPVPLCVCVSVCV